MNTHLQDVPGAPKRTLQQRMGQRGMGGGGKGPQKPSWLPSLPRPGSGGSMARGRGGSSNQGLGVEVAAPRDTSLAATQAAVFVGKVQLGTAAVVIVARKCVVQKHGKRTWGAATKDWVLRLQHPGIRLWQQHRLQCLQVRHHVCKCVCVNTRTL